MYGRAGTTGVVPAAIIEYRKVFVFKEWSYTPLMPTLFGIGLSPLVQLSVTGLAAFWLTRRVLPGSEFADIKFKGLKKRARL